MSLSSRVIAFLAFLGTALNCLGWSDAAALQTNSFYQTRTVHSRDGIGKFYAGREIAHIMGHEGADWLERPEREKEEGTDKLVQILSVQPGQVVADIGCGTGYYTRKLAVAVGTNGAVYAVDIQPEMLTLLTNKLSAEGIHNVKPILGAEADPGLPADSQDLIILIDVYHELEFPREMTLAMKRSLKPQGRLVLVEYRGEDPHVPIKLLHKMTESQARKEMELAGMKWKEGIETLPWQHILVFQKPSLKD